jgi:hypothetical protein
MFNPALCLKRPTVRPGGSQFCHLRNLFFVSVFELLSSECVGTTVKMHEDEPSLLSHFNVVRSKSIPEGGLSTVIYCGKVQTEGELVNALQVHREIVENEVNKEQVNVTGILMGQVSAVYAKNLFL